MRHQYPLQQMLAKADKKILIGLVEHLANISPETRRKCFGYLKEHVKLSPDQKETSDGEAVFALWGELEPDLAELDDYGGGDYRLSDHVEELLYQVQQKLEEKTVPADYRTELLDEILPYIQSSNAGLDDNLYGVAYTCCYDNEELRLLAQNFEDIGKDWPVDHARRIYKRIGDNEQYLELRALKMECGADYHDLATFYWQNGEKDKAVRIARQGLKNGNGRLDELRQFLSKRAQETGDRKGYLQLQFEQAIAQLTLKTYQEFKKLCTKDEWVHYEETILKKLDKAWGCERLLIHMYRKEYDKAITVLLQERYPYNSYDGEPRLKVAAKLEKRFPDKILAYYRSGLGNLNQSLTRKEYAQKAKTMKKVRHMYVDIVQTPEKWESFALKVKVDNRKRPAFQEEFGSVVPGWKTI